MEYRCQFPHTHSTSDHGLGEWLDHPENPPLPQDLAWLSRPWEKKSRWLPLPKYYYTGDIKLLPSREAPRLPADYGDDSGFTHGLWDKSKPYFNSFECVVALNLNKPKPKFTKRDDYPSDDQILKRCHLFPRSKDTKKHGIEDNWFPIPTNGLPPTGLLESGCAWLNPAFEDSLQRHANAYVKKEIAALRQQYDSLYAKYREAKVNQHRSAVIDCIRKAVVRYTPSVKAAVEEKVSGNAQGHRPHGAALT